MGRVKTNVVHTQTAGPTTVVDQPPCITQHFTTEICMPFPKEIQEELKSVQTVQNSFWNQNALYSY